MMICGRIGLRYASKARLLLPTINIKNNNKSTRSKPSNYYEIRTVHSTNIHEIDYLVSRYKLSNRAYGQNDYGQKNSRLRYFNRIEDFSYKTDKDIIKDYLRHLFDINKTEVNKLTNNYPSLTEQSVGNIQKQYDYLTDKYLIDKHQLYDCPWMLYLPLSFIRERLDSCSTINITNDYLVLLLLPYPSFERLSKKLKNNTIDNIFNDFNNRLTYFTDNLNLTHEEFCDLIHDNIFLFSYDFKRLEQIMNLLLSANIDPDLIVGDIRIFTHNIQLMKSRIKQCNQYGMAIKTWMLRSAHKEFHVSLTRHIENKKVLKDHHNNIDYLANQLNCSHDVIRSMMKRYPRIVSVSAKKLSSIISFLFKNGFSTYHIVDTPKILFHSVEKIDKRTKELAKLNLTPNALKILTLSDEEYEKLMEQLKSISVSKNDETEYLKSHATN